MSTSDETYNGWRNVETWRVQLHLANDETESRRLGSIAGAYAVGAFPARVAVCTDADIGETRSDGGPFQGTFAECIRDRVERMVERVYKTDDSTTRGTFEMFARDVVEAALARVDWEQIAAHWLQVARDELKPVEPAT